MSAYDSLGSIRGLAELRSRYVLNHIEAQPDGLYPVFVTGEEFDALRSEPEFKAFLRAGERLEHLAITILTATCHRIALHFLGVALYVDKPSPEAIAELAA